MAATGQAWTDGLVPYLEPDDIAAAFARDFLPGDRILVRPVQRQSGLRGVAELVESAQVENGENSGPRTAVCMPGQEGMGRIGVWAAHSRLTDARGADERASPRWCSGAGNRNLEPGAAVFLDPELVSVVVVARRDKIPFFNQFVEGDAVQLGGPRHGAVAVAQRKLPEVDRRTGRHREDLSNLAVDVLIIEPNLLEIVFDPAARVLHGQPQCVSAALAVEQRQRCRGP